VLCREFGPYAPVVPFQSLAHVLGHSNVEETVPALQHVAEPDLFCSRHASSGFFDPSSRLRQLSGQAGGLPLNLLPCR